jgi:hypothetical protein
MEINFISVMRKPSPQELLRAVLQLLPDFADYWGKPTNYFRDSDGSFSLHGLFSELTNYVKANFDKLDDVKRHALFKFVEECVVIDPQSESGVSNAACTCFLENLAGEGDLSQSIVSYLGIKSKEYFDNWI